MGPLELEEWAGSLEDENACLRDENAALKLTKAAYTATIEAKNVELKRLRTGLAELAVENPPLTNRINRLVRGE